MEKICSFSAPLIGVCANRVYFLDESNSASISFFIAVSSIKFLFMFLALLEDFFSVELLTKIRLSKLLSPVAEIYKVSNIRGFSLYLLFLALELGLKLEFLLLWGFQGDLILPMWGLLTIKLSYSCYVILIILGSGSCSRCSLWLSCALLVDAPWTACCFRSIGLMFSKFMSPLRWSSVLN